MPHPTILRSSCAAGKGYAARHQNV
jgi:hypothetical protein